MDRVAEQYGISKTALAIAWLVRIPAKMQVIAGTTKPSRLLDIIRGAEVELARPDWYEIYRAAGNRLP